MNHSQEFSEVATALAKAQGAMHSAEKIGVNPHFKSTYATLAAVVEACKSALSDNGIAFIQYGHDSESGCKIETIFYHSSGQWISAGFVFVPADKFNAHGMGSAMTYARRYALSMACGIPQEDDDGNSAVANPPARKPVRVVDSALDGVDVDWKKVGDYVAPIQAAIYNQDDSSLQEMMAELSEDSDLKLGVWSKLNSKERSYISSLTAETKKKTPA